MSDTKIFEAAIRKAMNAGWNKDLMEHSLWSVHPAGFGKRLILCIPNLKEQTKIHLGAAEVLFDEEFGRALWGEGKKGYWESDTPMPGLRKWNDPVLGWKEHFQQMVVTPNWFEYLEKNT